MNRFQLLLAALVIGCAGLRGARAAAPPVLDPARVQALFVKLDDDRFAVRQRADRALRKLGKHALPLLRAELVRTTSLEVRKRLRRMVHDLTVDERIPDLVRQLGAPVANWAEAADWELRRYGKAVVPLLKKELTADLKAEQRSRVEKIIAELSAPRPR
jgi:hypothetical protein